jgi:hypothetical protein
LRNSTGALSATLEIDVDLLERELYAMNQSTDDFVEIPRWVRLWTNAWWSTGPRPSRRQAHIAEAICMGCGVIFLVASFLLPHLLVPPFRVGAGIMLVSGYLLSVSIRIVDTYKLWPGTEMSRREWRPVRTLRMTVIDYTFVLAVLIVFFGLVFWLAA